MSKNIELVDVIALHDLSYVDHNKEPQYRRQGSRPFQMERGTAEGFAARKALKFVNELPAPAPVVEQSAEEVDEFADEVPGTDPVEDVEVEAEVEAEAEKPRGFFGGKKKKG